jgi:hypothetical protein
MSAVPYGQPGARSELALQVFTTQKLVPVAAIALAWRSSQRSRIKTKKNAKVFFLNPDSLCKNRNFFT